MNITNIRHKIKNSVTFNPSVFLSIVGLIFLLLFSSCCYGRSYTQAVLQEYFNIHIPNDIILNAKFNSLQDILKTKSSLNHTDVGLHYGTFVLKEHNGGISAANNMDGQYLWIYNNLNIHHGVFVIINTKLEVVYFNSHLGMLYDLEIKDLLHNGIPVLMITHGAGGTGLYAKVIDLILFRKGIPKLVGAILKETRDCNIRLSDLDPKHEIKPSALEQLETPGAICIECNGKIEVTATKDKQHALKISIINTIKLYEKFIKETNRKRFKALVARLIKTNFKQDLNMPQRSLSAIIEDLEKPIITYYPGVCPGYFSLERTWPTINLNSYSCDRP